LRNIGGSIGISVVNTIVARHEQLHRNELVASLNPGRVTVRHTIQEMQSYLFAQGTSPVTALQRAYSLIGRTVALRPGSGPMSTIFGTWPWCASHAYRLCSRSRSRSGKKVQWEPDIDLRALTANVHLTHACITTVADYALVGQTIWPPRVKAKLPIWPARAAETPVSTGAFGALRLLMQLKKFSR